MKYVIKQNGAPQYSLGYISKQGEWNRDPKKAAEWDTEESAKGYAEREGLHTYTIIRRSKSA